jgi:hypothetical protein
MQESYEQLSSWVETASSYRGGSINRFWRQRWFRPDMFLVNSVPECYTVTGGISR